MPRDVVERIEALLRGSPLPARFLEQEQVGGRLEHHQSFLLPTAGLR